MEISNLLQKHYKIKSGNVTKLTGGFRNQCFLITTDEASFVFILYKPEPGIKKLISSAHFVSNVLRERNFPVRYPLKTISGKTILRFLSEKGVQYCALYNYLEGKTIPWEAYTRRHLKSMGMMMSNMHHVLRKMFRTQSQDSHLKYTHAVASENQFSIRHLPSWKDVTEREIHEMQKYLQSVEPWIIKKLGVSLPREKIESLLDTVIENSLKFEHGILHYDFTRGNVLFSELVDEKLDVYPVVGVLDFEKVCIGPFIADIARTLSFLLVDCKYKDTNTVRKRFLLSGYQRRGKRNITINTSWKKQLHCLIQFFLLRDFWKFLENNPYEDLYMNEHYIRTRNHLLNEELLVTV